MQYIVFIIAGVLKSEREPNHQIFVVETHASLLKVNLKSSVTLTDVEAAPLIERRFQVRACISMAFNHIWPIGR